MVSSPTPVESRLPNSDFRVLGSAAGGDGVTARDPTSVAQSRGRNTTRPRTKQTSEIAQTSSDLWKSGGLNLPFRGYSPENHRRPGDFNRPTRNYSPETHRRPTPSHENPGNLLRPTQTSKPTKRTPKEGSRKAFAYWLNQVRRQTTGTPRSPEAQDTDRSPRSTRPFPFGDPGETAPPSTTSHLPVGPPASTPPVSKTTGEHDDSSTDSNHRDSTGEAHDPASADSDHRKTTGRAHAPPPVEETGSKGSRSRFFPRTNNPVTTMVPARRSHLTESPGEALEEVRHRGDWQSLRGVLK